MTPLPSPALHPDDVLLFHEVANAMRPTLPDCPSRRPAGPLGAGNAYRAAERATC